MNHLLTPSEEGFKAQARHLKAFLEGRGTALNYTTCLDAVAVQHGHASWQHAKAFCAQEKTNQCSPNDAAERDAEEISRLLLEPCAKHESTLETWAESLIPGGTSSESSRD